MPKKMALVDYSACRPDRCDRGICLAALACPRHILSQEAAYEMPDPNPSMCVGCGVCAGRCPLKAIRLVVM
jgi:translation initiation factor RLI1